MAYKDTSDYKRLDNLLVELGHFSSRSRARDAIKRGTVKIDGSIASKASAGVAPDARIEVDDPAQAYVSRSALKLVAALKTFQLNPAGCFCLDIGASTGGFTQVLLEHGASQVIALDVGHDQLHDELRNHADVIVMEGVNARELDQEALGEVQPNFIVSDVSFISLRLALPPALELAPDGSKCVLLVKPQFEVGRERVGKGGIVAPEDGERVAQELFEWLNELPGWQANGLVPSPITGGDGNLEYLLTGTKNG